MFTRVDVIAQNDDLWSFEFVSDVEANSFADMCASEGYIVKNIEMTKQSLIGCCISEDHGKWTAQEAFDCIQENS